jgi:hypothetical protein
MAGAARGVRPDGKPAVESVGVQRVGDIVGEDAADQELRVRVPGLRGACGEDQVRADTDRAIDEHVDDLSGVAAAERLVVVRKADVDRVELIGEPLCDPPDSAHRLSGRGQSALTRHPSTERGQRIHQHVLGAGLDREGAQVGELLGIGQRVRCRQETLKQTRLGQPARRGNRCGERGPVTAEPAVAFSPKPVEQHVDVNTAECGQVVDLLVRGLSSVGAHPNRQTRPDHRSTELQDVRMHERLTRRSA